MKKLITLVAIAALSINSFVASANKPQMNPKGWELNSLQDYNGVPVRVTKIQDLPSDTQFGVESKTIYNLFVPGQNASAKLTVTQSEDGVDESETFTYQDSNSWGKTLGKILAATAIVSFWAFKAYTKSFK